MIERYLEQPLLAELPERMGFVSGPRQVGKTTLARQIETRHFGGHCQYLNWDNRADRQVILNGGRSADAKLVIFDEIHKYRDWKNYLKGEYDGVRGRQRFLVTGSARLDCYRRGGDSLLGRYRHFRLHPLSVSELAGPGRRQFEPFGELDFPVLTKTRWEAFNALARFGGFPGVFVKQSERALRLWHNEKVELLLREEIRELSQIRDLSGVQVLVELLPARVGSRFSLNALREDLHVNHPTIASWVETLEQFYYLFRIQPFHHRRINALRKEPKMYLWDWTEAAAPGPRLENIVAAHLLKFCHYLHDVDGHRAQLHYLRDREQREVDFLVTVDNRPWFAVEVKSGSTEVTAPLRYFHERLKPPHSYLVVDSPKLDVFKDGIRVMSAAKFLGGLV